MVPKPRHDPPRDIEAVGAAVEREVRPTIRVALPGRRGEVRGIGEDSVERAESGREVGADRGDALPSGAGPFDEPGERVRVAVGRDDEPAGPRGREAELAVPAADLQQPTGAGFRGEREEEDRVLADRIDRRENPLARAVVGS
jgi:hypothetical protein